MNWAFELLGLRPDADAASIKRAYAQLLRSTRPDEDPEGFQRLHAAYKTALAQVNTAAPAVVAPPPPLGSNAPSTPATPSTATRPEPQAVAQPRPVPTINIGALAGEVIRVATGDSRKLTAWLQARQEFWSIQVKQQTAQAVMQRLFQQPQAMSAESLNALLKFFDLDHVLSGINPYALQQLRRRQSLQWELTPEHHYELMQRIQLRRNGRPDQRALQHYLALLQQPLTWLAVVKTVLRGGALDRLGHFLQALCQGHLDDLPASFDRRSVQFWYKANHAGAMSGPRFAVNTLRVIVIGFVCALLASIVFAISFSAGSMPGKDALRLASTFSFAIVGGVVGVWLMIAGWIYLDDWQGLPESTASRRPWLRRLLIPALCTIGFGLHELGASDYIAGPMVFVSLFLALRRFRRRYAPQAPRRALRLRAMLPWIYLCGIGISALIHLQTDSDFPVVPAAFAVTLCTWLADMWRHRAHVHPRFARS
ncbi:J domain-containing protein [Dyella acidiphila]|uniref:J domain-containing protein n=1 Tax=Dyella acidiphila TaxID=2775866 RepID=A0ABR9G7C7_9GAMM|nr:J domain-containing protein [Dyella acidiphila]MBE1159952.1 hypothetical protein [Dyella acidiphila]